MLGKEIYELPELALLVTEFFLRPPSVFNIGPCRIPPNDLSALVQEWVVPDEEPAILPIFSPSPLLVFERNSAGKGFLPFFAKPLNVLGMENALPKIAGAHVLERQSGILQAHPIGVNGSPLWIQDDDRLRNEVGDASKLFFILTELGLTRPEGVFCQLPLDRDSGNSSGTFD